LASSGYKIIVETTDPTAVGPIDLYTPPANVGNPNSAFGATEVLNQGIGIYGSGLITILKKGLYTIKAFGDIFNAFGESMDLSLLTTVLPVLADGKMGVPLTQTMTTSVFKPSQGNNNPEANGDVGSKATLELNIGDKVYMELLADWDPLIAVQLGLHEWMWEIELLQPTLTPPEAIYQKQLQRHQRLNARRQRKLTKTEAKNERKEAPERAKTETVETYLRRLHTFMHKFHKTEMSLWEKNCGIQPYAQNDNIMKYWLALMTMSSIISVSIGEISIWDRIGKAPQTVATESSGL
jgi:hypothetical protein